MVVDRRELKDTLARALRFMCTAPELGDGGAAGRRVRGRAVNGPSAPRDPRAWLTTLEHFGIKLGLSSIQALCAALWAIPSGSSARCTSPAPTAKAPWPRWSTRPCGRPATAPAATPRHISCASRSASRSRASRSTAALLDGALDTVRTAVDDAAGRRLARGAPHVLRGHHRRGVRGLRASRRGRCGARSRARRALRCHQRRRTCRRGNHVHRAGPRAASRCDARGDRLREGGHRQDPEFRWSSASCPRRRAGSFGVSAQERGARLHDAAAECVVARARQNGRTHPSPHDAPARVPADRARPPRRSPGAERRGRGSTARTAGRARRAAVRRLRSRPASQVPAGPRGSIWCTVGGGREVLVDGAHNPAGAAALAAYVRSEWPDGSAAGVRRDARQGFGGHAAAARASRSRSSSRPPRDRGRPTRRVSPPSPARWASTIRSCALTSAQALAAGWDARAADRGGRIAVSGRPRARDCSIDQ